MLLRPSGVLGSGSRPARACPGAISVSQLPFRQGVRLAVDVGSVRVGVARSDPGGILASPLAVLASGPGAKAAQARAELARLAANEGASEVIVGLPTSLSGREGTAAAGAREFAADLAGRLAPVPVRLVDERFTTTEAHDALRRGGQDARAVRPGSSSALAMERARERERRRMAAEPAATAAFARIRRSARPAGSWQFPGPPGVPGPAERPGSPGPARSPEPAESSHTAGAARTPGSAGAPEAAGAVATSRRQRPAPG